MNPCPFGLSQPSLKPFLIDQLGPEELQRLEDHLSICETCRERLDEQTASPNDWHQVKQCFADDSVPTSENGTPIDSQSPSLHDDLTYFKQLLGPTDHPTMLGRIAHYEIIGVLGRGGTGVVFKGFDPSLNRFVAIKMILPSMLTSDNAKERFRREAQSAAAVVHDHVVAIHSIGEWQGLPYLVMTYIRGESLQKRLARKKQFELREVLRIGMQIASGLAAAHCQGLIHRDIKPANVLLESDVDRARITDFGLARAIDDIRLTRTEMLIGTPMYMSPEQARDDALDFRSDLFSLGSLLYEMCAGQPPFQAASSYAVLRKVIDSNPVSLRELNPNIPNWLEQIIDTLMHKHADQRFQSAAEVAGILQQCLAHIEQPTWINLPDQLRSSGRLPNRWFPRFSQMTRLSKRRLFMSILISSATALGVWMIYCSTMVPPSDELRVEVAGVADVGKQRMTTEFNSSKLREMANRNGSQLPSRTPGSTNNSGGFGGSGFSSGSTAGFGSGSGAGSGSGTASSSKSGSTNSKRSQESSESSRTNGESSKFQFERKFESSNGSGESSFGGSIGSSGGSIRGFGGGFAGGGGSASGGGGGEAYAKPNIGIAIDVQLEPQNKKSSVQIEQKVKAVGDNGKEYSVNREMTVLHFPEFEKAHPGKHFLYLSVPDQDVKKLTKVEGHLRIVPERSETIEFTGTDSQTITKSKRKYKLLAVQTESSGIRASLELPDDDLDPTSLKTARSFAIEDSMGDLHSAMGTNAIKSNASQFNTLGNRNQKLRDNAKNNTKNETKEATESRIAYDVLFPSLPSGRSVKRIILKINEQTGEPKTLPFELHDVQIRD